MAGAHSADVAALATRAHRLGFEAFGIARADSRPDLPEKLDQALENGWMADMDWMADTAARRRSPQALWPQARSIVMVGMNYGPQTNPLARLADPGLGNVSVYAQRRDYHDVIKGKLKELAGVAAKRLDCAVKVFVDTAPVMEKPLAETAGVGWQGKHTVTVSREHGSWLFLGALFVAADLPESAPHRDSCGSCRRCLDVCPTDAFPAPYQLDARKCLAYYSIEHDGPIPHQFRKPMGNRIFGCDDCLAVCPWNKFAHTAREDKLAARSAIRDARLADLLDLDDPAFRALFAGTPVKRLGVTRFLRNVLIAAGNSDDPALIPKVRARLDDPAPLVRGAAVWAMGALADEAEREALKARYAPRESDASVRGEWEAV